MPSPPSGVHLRSYTQVLRAPSLESGAGVAGGGGSHSERIFLAFNGNR